MGAAFVFVGGGTPFSGLPFVGTDESTAAEACRHLRRWVGRLIHHLLDGPEIEHQPDDNAEKNRDYGEGLSRS